MKVLTIVGARPQFIKAAAVSRAFQQHPSIEEVIVHTGQHFDPNMSEVFFKELSIPAPHLNLGIASLDNELMIEQMNQGISKAIQQHKPDVVMVYGDTNSTLAGAKAAHQNGVLLAHVEAGLRSFNKQMVEERNRIETDQLAGILFCPSQVAIDNLQNEGIIHTNKQIIFSGDVMYDSVLFYKAQIQPSNKKHVLATLHRAETTNDLNQLKGYFDGLEAIHQETEVVMPLHPRTKQALHSFNMDPQIRFLAPQSYLAMLQLIEESELVMTDSGGLQKEAYFMKKPCITMRPETEWTELVDAGVNCLVTPGIDAMIHAYHTMRTQKIEDVEPFYGAGNAAQIIANTLLQ